MEFKDVSFSYDDNKEALHNISFTANEGSVTALIGESGAGKKYNNEFSKILGCNKWRNFNWR